VDKYEAFHEILPAVIHTTTEQKETVSDILDRCCTALLQLLRLPKKPTKPVMKKVLVTCMDELSIAPVDMENKEFGYQLGWYLAEKVAVNLRKGTEKKVWGYWQIDGNEVKAPIRPRISGKSVKKAMEEEVVDVTAIVIR
jgi:hypothetical protein